MALVAASARIWAVKQHEMSKKPLKRLCVCRAGSDGQPRSGRRKQRGEGYYERYRANRARHEGVLLPPLPRGPGIPHIPQQELQDYLAQELWAYTFGLPSPHRDEEARGSSVRRGHATNAVAANTAPPSTSATSQQQPQPGVVIPPPDAGTGLLPSDLVLPPLPSTSPSNCEVYVFWDVAAKHPAARDPRVVCERLRALASAYGTPAGMFAYALRKDWNWVPEYLLRYRDPTAHSNSTNGMDGVNGTDGTKGTSDTARRETLLTPATGPASAIVTAASSTFAPAAPATAGSPVWRNTSRRTLGRVARYETARGETLVPPPGHQLSLKYVVSKEGWEVRVVLNAAEAESVAMSSGLRRFLDRVRDGHLPVFTSPPGTQLVVILVAEDEGRLAQPLVRLRGIGGVATLVVRSEGGSEAVGGRGISSRSIGVFKGADVEVSWDAVMRGVPASNMSW